MLDYEQVFPARQHLALSLLSYITLHSSLKWASYFSMQELLGEIFLSVDYEIYISFSSRKAIFICNSSGINIPKWLFNKLKVNMVMRRQAL